jgi:ribose-phosphate pyrophosphokinase
MTLVICGTKSNWFCENFSRRLGVSAVTVEYKKFKDGESYIRIPENIAGEDVIILQSLSQPQNDSIWELFLIIDAATNLRAKSISLYVPYLAYSRQDKIFREGEPISIKVLLQTLSFLGASRLYTIDIHKESSLSYFRGPSKNILPVRTMCASIMRYTKDPLIIAPDIGALERARRYSEVCGTDFDYLEKRRDRVTGEITMKPKKIRVEGRDALIVDDIISTGSTTANAARILYQHGAANVYSLVSHALLIGDAIEKLKKAGIRKIIAANTLPPKSEIEYVDITDEVIEYFDI